MPREPSVETTFLNGGTELHEPAAVADQTITALDMMIASIRSGSAAEDETIASFGSMLAAADRDIKADVLKERLDEMRPALQQAQNEYQDCIQKRDSVDLGYERVREMGAQGPGRGLRLFGRYKGPDGHQQTFFVYPRDFAIHKLPYQLRNLIQRCVIG